MNSNIRTDLALEVRESYEGDNVEIKGVELYEEVDSEGRIKITTVIIKDKHGMEAMNKPIGTYITLENVNNEEDYLCEQEMFEVFEKNFSKMIDKYKGKNILVVGLGNKDITPDSIGPKVVDSLFVTRHLIREYGNEFKEKNNIENISAISPGVMGQTGMESKEIIKGIVREANIDLVIVIDALAARSTNRLVSTIQLTDTGISPGSGVGNNRKAINKESVGVDVIAVGVPTVVDAFTIANDIIEVFMSKQELSREEKDSFVNELRNSFVKNMFVTPKDIDEAVNKISNIISDGLNSVLSIS